MEQRAQFYANKMGKMPGHEKKPQFDEEEEKELLPPP